jgi:hypothetical protein
MAFSSLPSAAVLIHPSQGKAQGLGQAQAVAAAVLSLNCELTSVIEWQTHNESLYRSPLAVVTQHQQIMVKTSSLQRRQGRHRDTERVTSCEADASPTNVQTEHRTC